MRFAKYHGIGNDFVMIADPEDRLDLTAEMVRRLCDRRFGVGGDGVIRVAPGDDGAALFMDYVNSDGSIGEMCGNGIRCLALFAREHGLAGGDELKVSTRAGMKVVQIVGEDQVQVDMGAPIFAPDDIPVRWEGSDALDASIGPLPPPEAWATRDGVAVAGAGQSFMRATCLSMGNPHAVLFVEDVDEAPVATLGPAIETLAMFPNKTNVEFAAVESSSRLRMRVWERGAGETMACGTGACAVAVAARLVKDTDEAVTVALPGGELRVAWEGSVERDGPVLMTGPATKVFEGDIEL